MTVDYAERVGHSFARDYNAAFFADVYASLQSLTAETRQSLTPLGPQDNIDLQSFIWIVGAYPETDEVAALPG